MPVLASLEVEDDGTLKIRNFRDALSDLEGQSGKTGNALDKLGSDSDRASGGLSSIKDQAAAAAIAFGALGGGLTALLTDAGMLAARVEVLNTVLGVSAKNANLSSIELLKQVEGVKALGITTQAATQTVISFVQAQIDVEKAAKLARVAQDLAVVAGMNSSQATQVLTNSIQSQEVVTLRQFGIVTGLQQIYTEYSATLGKNWKELDAQEKKQAFLNKILTEGEKVSGAYEAAMGDAGKQIGSFARYTEEARLKLGQALTPAMLAGVEAATDLFKWFNSLDGATIKLITTLTVLVATMATLSAAVAASKFFSAAGLFTAMLSPVGLLITALGILAAAYVFLKEKQANHTEEMIQSYAKAEAINDKYKELLNTYDLLGLKTNKTEAEQKQYNNTVNALAKLTPDVVSGINQQTGALELNRTQLARNLAANEALLASELARVRAEFAKREQELAEARKVANASALAQLDAEQKLNSEQAKSASQRLEIINSYAAAKVGALGYGDSLKTTTQEVEMARRTAAEHQKTLIEVTAAYNKEKDLIDQLDPKRREEIKQTHDAVEALRLKKEAQEKATAAAQKHAEELAKAAAKERAAMQGLSDDERQRYTILNDLLTKAGRGTDEYNRLVDLNKNLIEGAAKAHHSMTDGLKEIAAAQQRLKDLAIEKEIQKWTDKATESVKAFEQLAGQINKSFGEDVKKIFQESETARVTASQTAAAMISKTEEDLYVRTVGAKATEVEKKLAENDKYYDGLIRANNKEIDSIQQLLNKQRQALIDAADARKRDVDDIVQKAVFKFQTESDQILKLGEVKKAAEAGDLDRAARLRDDFIANVKQMGDEEKGRIDESLAEALRENEGKAAALKAQIGAFQAQNDKIRQVNKETNAIIIKDYDTLREAGIAAWQKITDSVVNAVTGILTGQMTLKEGIISIWHSILSAVTDVMHSMVKKWVESLFKMDEASKAGGGGGGKMSGLMGGKVGGAIGVGLTSFAVGSAFGGMTSNKTVGTLAGAGSGAATGAMMGSVVPGVGTAIGAGVGAIAGAIGGYMASRAKEKELQAAMKDQRDEIIKTYGSLEEFKKAADKAGVSIDKLMSTKSTKEFGAELLKVKAGMDAYKTMIEGVDIAVAGMNTRATGFSMELKRSVDEQTKVIQARYDMEQERQKALGASSSELNDLKKAQELELTKTVFTATEEQQASFDRLGTFALAMFGKVVKETGSIKAAFEAINPTLDILIEAQKKFGFEYGGTVEKLLGIREVIKANDDVFTSLEGIQQMLKGLAQAGMLTQEMFISLGHDAANQFQILKDRGVDADTAMGLMQPTLQMLWEQQQKFGRVTDEATQALIDQAETQGLVGADMKDVNERILDVLKLIGKALGADIPDALGKQAGALGGVADQLDRNKASWRTWRDTAVGAAKDVEGAVDGVSVGHSPGGIKEITNQLHIARHAAGMFSRDFINELSKAQIGASDFSIDTTRSDSNQESRMDSLASAVTDLADNVNNLSSMDSGLVIELDGQVLTNAVLRRTPETVRRRGVAI